MSIAARKLYWITAAVFLMIVFLSYHKSTVPYSADRTANTDVGQSQDYDDNDGDYTSGDGDNIYSGDNKTPSGTSGNTSPNPSIPNPPPTVAATTPLPNTSGKYDTLVVIPSSWTQIQNRQWVRETVFGIRDNLEPCKKNDGNIIYKFYIYGRSTWAKSAIHSPEFNQAMVRDLYGEFMEFNDNTFTNTTVADKSAIWGDALNWAITTYIPANKIQVDKVLIFDSTTIVNLPKMEEVVKASANPNGFLHIWGGADLTTFAAMISFDAADQILKHRAQIKINHPNEDVISAASTFYAKNPAAFKIVRVTGQLWASNVDQISADAAVVGQVYQREDWRRITDKLSIKPTPACAVDENRKKNIALLTSSYIYVDMCMAEASLPSAENKRTYADQHGYDFVARAAEFAQEEHRGRRLVWGKIGAIQKVLPHYQWLFWMDMDAVIADLDKDLRAIIQTAEEEKGTNGEEISLIVARPKRDKMLNAGVMLIKNTEWSRAFFNEVQTRAPWYHKSSYEQAAIWEVMNEPKWASGVYLYDGDDHTMNTFPKLYANGDFVIHFAPAGCPSVPVLAALAKIKAGESALGIGAE
ncbi:hypothetical protein BGZ95_011789 [Linnemannia exigua]|uniref:Glycosyltransferase family 34 protein n=1 Tax=Linnemannia exigua TaxID=604196 RepID=A0AAD4H675_9FUNG|nr:hypothetical protein BGZ95_011789 [Linnemannia exigua]